MNEEGVARIPDPEPEEAQGRMVEEPVDRKVLSRNVRQMLLTQANGWLDISESLVDAELVGFAPEVIEKLSQVQYHLSKAARFGLSAAVSLIRKEG